MSSEEIIEELRLQNPWWSGKYVKLPENTIERELFPALLDELERELIIGIIGLRRVGKTTLLKTIIKHFMSKIEPIRICYFSFDLGDEFEPLKIVKVYCEEILRESLSELSSRVYFFFDEIQKVKNWGNQIKSLYDKGLNV
ncbi:MAG: AAA family ATPase, partial [Candidatus Thermoplasmatota archaeon]|nr:AAA family ATPase [Candidatus Thermoplasmatota archaeon]